MIRAVRGALAFFLLLLAVPAAAAEYLYTITDEDSGATVAAFILRSNPTPDGVNDPTCPTQCFFVEDVVNRVDGSTIDYVTFYQNPNSTDIALTLEDGGDFTFVGQTYDDRALYNGSETRPVLYTSGTDSQGNPKPFQLYDNTGSTTKFYLLTVEAVPEPATWLMMIMGFGIIGVVIRRQQGVPLGGKPASLRASLA